MTGRSFSQDDGVPPAQAPGWHAAETVRAACVNAAIQAYDDAGMSGLCAEGRWEAALAAIRQLDLRRVLELPSGSATAEPAQQPSSSSSGEP